MTERHIQLPPNPDLTCVYFEAAHDDTVQAWVKGALDGLNNVLPTDLGPDEGNRWLRALSKSAMGHRGTHFLGRLILDERGPVLELPNEGEEPICGVAEGSTMWQIVGQDHEVLSGAVNSLLASQEQSRLAS